MRILYDSKKTEYKTPFGALRQGEKCRISIKVPAYCLVKKAEIRLREDLSGEELRFQLSKTETADGYETFSATFALEEKGLYFYHFYFECEKSSFALYKYGESDTNIEAGELWQITCYDKDFSVPESFKGKVMYQIFPDRFHRENICNFDEKLKPFKIKTDLNETPDYLPNEKGEVLNCDFYGGNLKGIEEKLEYIKSLGVSIIYLNPIFMAYSNHRYDTCDYKKIDPLLGTEEDFESLCNKAHSLGIKIILDGVFSHTGSRSIYFDAENEFGSGVCSCENSPYKDWFTFKNFPNDYDSWWGIKTLPCVNEMSDGFLNYIIRDRDSVLEHWLKLGADGFRLDVADELPDEFIKLLRDKVKEIKKDSFVLGEVWEDASNKISYGKRRKYFSHAELDSVMNYVFKNAVISYVKGEIGAKEFSEEVMTIAENYPPDALFSLMNSLSTHDTERIVTALSSADKNMPKEKMADFALSGDELKEALSKVFVATFLQFVLPGNSCIYYGDEMAMQAFGDPFCRGYFTDKNKNEDLFELVKMLSEIKNKSSALKEGNIKIKTDNGVLILERKSQRETLYAVVNMTGREYRCNFKEALIHKNLHEDILKSNGFALFCK